MAKKKLTPNQLDWLGKIRAIPEGISETELLDLRGKAKNYAMSYRRSLESAIDAHNKGLAVNSPIAKNTMIETGPFGPKGGHGYRLAIDLLTQAAIQKLAEGENNGH
jgi:hypothetical protein